MSTALTSSIGWDSAEAPVESAIPARSAVGVGYGESKYVAERILQAVSEVTPLRPVCVRVGQMTGTVSGAWNSTDWVPAIARSGQVLGMLPDRADVSSSDLRFCILLHPNNNVFNRIFHGSPWTSLHALFSTSATHRVCTSTSSTPHLIRGPPSSKPSRESSTFLWSPGLSG
jgi:thioester reductase-like protein